MNRLTIVALALSLAGCAFADPAGNPWTVEDTPTGDPSITSDDPVGSDEPVLQPTERMSCELEVSEFQETWWVEPYFHEFSPNEGLFIAALGYDGHAVTVSVNDGQTYRSNNMAGLRDVDADWTTGVFMTNTPSAEWRDLRTGEVRYATEDAFGAAVSDDGEQAAFIVCSEQRTLARLIDASGATRDIELSNDGYCHRWAVNQIHIEFTSDGAHLVVSTMGGTLWTIDTATFDTVSTQPHRLLDEPDLYYSTNISDMSVRPGAEEVVTTGADGALRRWSVPELQQIGEDLEVGTFVINEMTYAPHYTVSPVAFSADGQTMAFMNTEHEVVLRNAAGDAVLPTPAVDEPAAFERAPNVPVTIAFAPSGQRVGVGYYWGPAVWGCPGEAIERQGALTIDVPSVVQLSNDGQTAIPLNIDSDGPIAAVRVLTADGEDYYQATFVDGVLNLWARHGQPERETIVIEADDGYATARATIQLLFIQ